MATPKQPSSKKVSPKVKAKRLDRNVNPRYKADALKSSDEYRKLLTDPEREAEAVEMLRRHAIESDPTKPGYEANEVVAPIVRAFTQLPASRRAALLERAGNPELFSNLPDGYDPLGEIPTADKKMLEDDLIASLFQPQPEKAGMSFNDMAKSPSTFAGNKFVSDNKPESVAAIDRNIPNLEVNPETGFQYNLNRDPETGALPELNADQEKARIQNIERIVGVPMWQQYMAATKKGLGPALPSMQQPTLKDFDALQERLSSPRGLIADTQGASARANNEIERIRGLDVDPEMERFGHVPAKGVFVSPQAMNELKIRALQERLGVEPEQRVFEPALHSLINGEQFDLAGAHPDVQRIIAMSHMTGGDPIHNFSDAEPTAVPNEEIKGNMIARLKASAEEAARRRAAFEAMPAGAAIGQQDSITPLTIGTMGLQEPYQPSRGRGSMTVDRQLDQSARSVRDRVIEAIYKASLADSSEPMVGDVSDFGKDDLLRRSDMGIQSAGKTVPLDKLFPGWRYQMPVRNADGQFEYPAYAPSAPFLADQIIGWHGIEDGDSFRRTAIPVLERSIAEQYHTFPQTKAAIKASRTRLVPGTGTRTNGYKFFTAPEAGDYMENMFDKRHPITQFEPQHFSQEPGRDILMPEEEAPIPDSVLDSILNSQEPGAQEEFDLNDLLNQPYDGEGDALSKTMNRNRSGLLHGLYA